MIGGGSGINTNHSVYSALLDMVYRMNSVNELPSKDWIVNVDGTGLGLVNAPM